MYCFQTEVRREAQCKYSSLLHFNPTFGFVHRLFDPKFG